MAIRHIFPGLRSNNAEPTLQDVCAGAATANLIAVTAPLDGTVVACNVVAGEVADLSKTLFTVADISRMWVVLQEDAARGGGRQGKTAAASRGHAVHFEL